MLQSFRDSPRRIISVAINWNASLKLISDAAFLCFSYRSGELILTHFSGESLAAHTNERRLTMGLHRGDRRAGTGGGL